MDSPVVGSLVVPSPRFRRQMETGEGAALMLATRRSSALLFYLSKDRGFWVPTRQIAAIPAEVLPDRCLERLLHEIMLYVEAEESEIEEFTLDGETAHLRISIQAPTLTRTQWTVLRARLGSLLGDLTFDPRSMSSILLRLELVGAPLPAPT